MSTHILRKYLDNDYHWSCAPSSFYDKNPAIQEDLAADNNVKAHIRFIDSDCFDVQLFCEDVVRIAENSEPIIGIRDY